MTGVLIKRVRGGWGGGTDWGKGDVKSGKEGEGGRDRLNMFVVCVI